MASAKPGHVLIDNKAFLERVEGEWPLYRRIVATFGNASDPAQLHDAVERYAHMLNDLRELHRKNDGQMKTKIAVDDFGIQVVWRVHMLHPHDYRRTCLRAFGPGAFLIPEYDPRTKTMLPVAARIDTWEATTKQEWRTEKKAIMSEKLVTYDLAAAVTRQLGFMRKVLKFRQSPRFVARAASRYKNFLGLLATVKNAVPPLDVDLIWHSHMLHPGFYVRDGMTVVGWLPDHDDEGGSGNLEESAEKTRKAWEDKHGPGSYIPKRSARKEKMATTCRGCVAGCLTEDDLQLEKMAGTCSKGCVSECFTEDDLQLDDMVAACST